MDVLVDALREPVAMLFDPSQRSYWGFLISALAIAGVLHLSGARRSGPALSMRQTFGHRSSGLDLQLVFANAVVKAVLAAAWAVSAFGLAVWLVGQLDGAFGPRRVDGLSTTTIAVAYTVVLFVAWDLSRYVLHRLLHEVPVLWELHKVHHSAEVLTPLTLYRVHPGESLLYAVRGVLVTGVVTGVFFHLFRGAAVELELLGVNLLGFGFNLVGANLRHSHVFWSWGRRVERWLISPAQHQLHHDVGDTGTNLGTWLAIWDRLGGTLRTAGRHPPAAFGLPAGACNHDPHRLWSALVEPLAAALGRLVPRRRRRRALAPFV